jgi:predicted methyltransferase
VPRTAPRHEAGRRAPARASVVVLYSLTLALSAGLVFMVQPMFARFVLPMLGGTPAVWTTAMLFFQSALLLAYLYAHWSTRRFGPRRQAALHLALVAAALLVLPIGVPGGWSPPAEGSPVPWLLAMLVVSVGLPFFVVSATAPLLQSWLAATDHPDAGDPYFLYRASNVGSVVGLLAYPALVERELALEEQSWLWSAGYGLFGLLLIACAVALWRSRRPVSAAAVASAPAEPLTRSRSLRWVALAFVPSSLMLAVTTAITINLAPIPLLWVLPLSLYLASFIVVFSRREGPGLVYRVAVLTLPVVVLLAAGVIVIGFQEPLWLIGAIHLVAFFAVALVCHGQLAADRPPTEHLTRFYALISLGGALGGVFNVVVAPLVFNSLTEYPLVLVLACFLLPLRSGSWTDQVSFRRHLLPPFLVGGGLAGAVLVTEMGTIEHRAAYIVAGLLCLALVRHPLRFGLVVAAVMVAAWLPKVDDQRVIYQDRSFFAVNRVTSTFDGLVHELKNGTIVHGAQIGGLGVTPVTYYHPTGPAGELFSGLPDRSIASRTAVVGLGTGSMACYSRPGDRFTFFEIDPAVERLARDNDLFNFLRDCQGRFDVVLGDARLSLERQPDREFGVIVLDAFSSDAIPIHLLTREAVELYRDKLRPGGVLALHISNKYLDLEPVVGNVAREAGLECLSRKDQLGGRRMWMKSASHWVAMARARADLGRVAREPRWQACLEDSGARTWSDDYSNVLSAFR